MNDTIAAIASGMTASGIGIIRISGPEAFSYLAEIFRPGRKGENPLLYEANTIHYGWITEGNPADTDSEIIDECLVMVMRKPHTYTTEDTVEIDCHGGPYVMRKILARVLKQGARMAEPGEFTKRAFLGGRIDLTKAEAVMDIIQSGSEDSLKSSLRQLSGSILREIRDIRGQILDELSYIEAALDDPEHYEMENYGEVLKEHLLPVRDRLVSLRKSYEEGKLVREGIMTVIVGKPNVGKSSLLNLLTGEERAIVTDIEGTTRDVIEEQVRIGSLTLRILDTAGIREARDQIERIGIERSRRYAEEADLILAVFDASEQMDSNDEEILNLIKDKNAIIIRNKEDLLEMRQSLSGRNSDGHSLDGQDSVGQSCDEHESVGQSCDEHESVGQSCDEQDSDREIGNGQVIDNQEREFTKYGFPVVTLSAKEGTGITLLEQEIRNMFFHGGITWNEEVMLTNSRHVQSVDMALSALKQVEHSIEAGMPEDFFSIDLMDAYARLGEIIGEEVEDDLVDNIFKKFCMGK